MEFRIQPGYAESAALGALFQEYTADLLRQKPAFAAYLEQQSYAWELLHLEEKYGMPGGRLYLATCETKPVGCIALHKLDAKRCELKRLYVRPAYREWHLGAALIQRVIDDAKAIGYACILLDTFPFLVEAIHLYRRLGFYEIERYNDGPMDDMLYFRLDLQK